MMKKKICWITPDYFADCDIPYVPFLSEYYDITWIILLPRNPRFQEETFRKIESENENLKVVVIHSVTRERVPFKMFEYLKVNKIIKRENPDVVYSNMVVSSPWQIPMFLLFPKTRTIVTAHQGRVHEGMGHYQYYNFLRDIVYKRIKNVNMFSKSQADFFQKRYSDSKIYQFPLGLKKFGNATIKKKNDDIIRFLSFGTINYAKHIDLLIDAACNVYEQGYKNIRIKIAGMCDDWDVAYLPRIKYPEIFENEIRMIDNCEIANLYTQADYFVQPYRVISQSGPFKIAMNYNTPLITSDLPGFTDEMVEGTTGFVFKTNDVISLENVLKKAIAIKESGMEYLTLKSKMKKHVEEVYSLENLVCKYTNMFNDLIDKI